MGFIQQGPQLAHPLHHDRVLRSWLQHNLDAAAHAALLPDLQALADYALQAYARRQGTPRREPQLTQWDAWGRRVDRIALTPAWEEGAALTAAHGLLWAGHAADARGMQRAAQFARVYLYHVASEFYTCPLAMTDGAATALKASGDATLLQRALPRFLSRDAATLWLSGQWMTETIGGSDVSRSEVEAHQDASGQWRLHGRKWFTSAIIGEAALTLARPSGAGAGNDALGMFYVETHATDGAWQPGLRIQRLKDKLGTRELPTAEIELDGLAATPVGEPRHGVRRIAPMLNITRTWNAICALASMRRALALALDYATRREAFGTLLIDKPLHRDTLAGLGAEFEAAFALGFGVARLLGEVEAGLADAETQAAWRILTPLAKLWTGKLAVRITSECLEACGGAGYIEDTGLPQLLRDAQVYPIWEGTTNVLALDTLRALGNDDLSPFATWLQRQWPQEIPGAADLQAALAAAAQWLLQASRERALLEAGARGMALTLARCAAATLLARQAQAAAVLVDLRPAASLRRFLGHGLLRLNASSAADCAAILAQD